MSYNGRIAHLHMAAVVIAFLLHAAASPGDDEPVIPGLDTTESEKAVSEEQPAQGAESSVETTLKGFIDARVGTRLSEDDYQKDSSLAEVRAQLDVEAVLDKITGRLVTDVLYDDVEEEHSVHLHKGTGWLDLRQANISFSVGENTDVKIGRQILTWGTGDLIFINDLFPKDWNSFFIGRDVEYLKAPSDSVRIRTFSLVNVDAVYTPRFASDRFIDGRRISYWNSSLGRTAGRDAVVKTESRSQWFTDYEAAVRIYKNVNGVEAAVYAYRGYWKSPAGSSADGSKALFPRLNVYGASARWHAVGGICNVETGYYDSVDDRDGNDPLIRNGEWRILTGYERELARDFTAAFQAYLERMTDYAAYKKNLPAGMHPKDHNRVVLTTRLTKLAMNQNLTLSAFVFFSPTDSDSYTRLRASYKVTDDWLVEVGANVFAGSHDYTFFGQFEDASNVYAAARYSF